MASFTCQRHPKSVLLSFFRGTFFEKEKDFEKCLRGFVVIKWKYNAMVFGFQLSSKYRTKNVKEKMCKAWSPMKMIKWWRFIGWTIPLNTDHLLDYSQRNPPWDDFNTSIVSPRRSSITKKTTVISSKAFSKVSDEALTNSYGICQDFSVNWKFIIIFFQNNQSELR